MIVVLLSVVSITMLLAVIPVVPHSFLLGYLLGVIVTACLWKLEGGT
jgi:hypothetical protein